MGGTQEAYIRNMELSQDRTIQYVLLPDRWESGDQVLAETVLDRQWVILKQGDLLS